MASTARSERPRFTDGDYIGAADLTAIVDYAREMAREGALGGQTWGICIGLDLVEVANASGGFDYFVLPGLAFDGYGRPIVVLSPAPVPASLFADFPTGNQPVWIRYDEGQTQGLRAGWQTCDAADAYRRVRETYAIEAGPMSLTERQGGVDVAGGVIPDARLALNTVSPESPLVCDGSIPQQTFPADTARWLVPLGAAAWAAGVPGSLGERSDDAKKASRLLRRYVGQVAESLYAADGVLRLRDRFTEYDTTKSVDEQCAATAMTADDLAPAGAATDRLVGNELVWVEGNLRVLGDARLWGTRLEFRDKKGKAEIPLHFNRSATINAFKGEDLELTIGTTADGLSRFVAGITPAGKPIETKFELRNDGRLAVGRGIPKDVKSHTVLAHTDADTSVAIAAASLKLGKLQFVVDTALTEAAHLGWDDAAQRLRIGAAPDPVDFLYMTPTGHVGIRTSTPEQQDGDANDLVVKSAANVGITLECETDFNSRINFSDGTTTAADKHAGSLLYNHYASRMEFWTGAATRVAIDGAGNVGIGTLVPASRLHIASLTDARLLRLDADRIRAQNGGAPSQLELQPDGGGVMFGGGNANVEQRLIVTGDGRIGAGANPPGAGFHLRNTNANLLLETTSGTAPRLSLMTAGVTRASLEVDPGSTRARLVSNGVTALTASSDKVGINLGGDAPTNNLHVRGSIGADAGQVTAHVALIENVNATNAADVLALKIGRSSPENSNHFLTLFGGNTMVGRIEGTGGGTQFQSGAGDFAECLLRESGDVIGPGRVVGVRGGRISLDTEGADALMVTTDRAVVVGNYPFEADKGPARDAWEQVAMVGQVPVFVEGPVEAGDWVLASERHDGCGRAVSDAALAPADVPRIVGRAWETCASARRRRILVAVGVAGATPASAAAGLIAAQEHRIAALEARVEMLAAQLSG